MQKKAPGKGKIVYFAIIIAIVVSLVLLLFLHSPHVQYKKTYPNLTSTVSTTQSNFTPLNNRYATGNRSSTNNNVALKSCSDFAVSTPFFLDTEKGVCYWNGGNLSIYYGGGNSSYINFTITGQNGKRYLDYGANSTCLKYYSSIYLPPQNYTVLINSGRGGGNCGVALFLFNSSNSLV
ncbi:MAG: hypothetical protein ACP5SJ_02690 [Candidatus Micrarchaeia archaeon]